MSSKSRCLRVIGKRIESCPKDPQAVRHPAHGRPAQPAEQPGADHHGRAKAYLEAVEGTFGGDMPNSSSSRVMFQRPIRAAIWQGRV